MEGEDGRVDEGGGGAEGGEDEGAEEGGEDVERRSGREFRDYR